MGLVELLIMLAIGAVAGRGDEVNAQQLLELSTENIRMRTPNIDIKEVVEDDHLEKFVIEDDEQQTFLIATLFPPSSFYDRCFATLVDVGLLLQQQQQCIGIQSVITITLPR